MPDDVQLETVKYYTKARKFPQLLGRFPDGTKIPGGPYTVQQLLGGVVVIGLGSMTMGIWGVFGGLGNIVVLLCFGLGTTFLIGRLPMNGRNPMYAAIGFFKAASYPSSGRYQGRAIKIRRPRTVTNMTNVWVGPLPPIGNPVIPHVAVEVASDPTIKARRRGVAGAGVTVGLPPAAGTSSIPLTGVQALLARAGASDSDKAVR